MDIFINGRAGAGKSEIEKRLIYHGYTPVQLSSGIYEIARNYFNMKKKDRELLQSIGQLLRQIDEDVWVKYACEEIDLRKYIEKSEKIVVSDVRQANEYDTFKDKGFIAIQVVADLDKRIERLEKRDGIKIDDDYIKRIEENPAETGADGKEYDYIIDNNGTIEELYAKVDEILEQQSNKGDKGKTPRKWRNNNRDIKGTRI